MEKADMLKRNETLIKKLMEFAEIVRDCPDNALHLMPLAAQAIINEIEE